MALNSKRLRGMNETKRRKSRSKSLPLISPAHFFWCFRRATQLNVDISGFPNVAAHFKRMPERPSVKKLLAYEKDVNEGFG
jgi:glutathione S-transferase